MLVSRGIDHTAHAPSNPSQANHIARKACIYRHLRSTRGGRAMRRNPPRVALA